jgi:hypothetical protein
MFPRPSKAATQKAQERFAGEILPYSMFLEAHCRVGFPTNRCCIEVPTLPLPILKAEPDWPRVP